LKQAKNKTHSIFNKIIQELKDTHHILIFNPDQVKRELCRMNFYRGVI